MELEFMVYFHISECDCPVAGSTNTVCAPLGGQCPCKPNVMLQDCSMCKVDHYGFSTGEEGCTRKEQGDIVLVMEGCIVALICVCLY